MQQAFHECHALQCGFCTPGFVTTVTAYLEDHPDPTRDEAREAISGNLCRCTGYVNIVSAVVRAAELRRRGKLLVTTRMVGETVLRVEDPRLVTGDGRYLDDLGHDALEVAFVRSPHAHARVLDIDVTDALDVDGLVAIYTYEDLVADEEQHGTRVAEQLPLLIPHPTLTHGRTQYALAKDEVNHVGEAIVMVVARDRYAAEDVVERIRVDYDFLPVVVGVEAARAAEHLVHDDVPGNVAAHMVQEIGDAAAAIDAAPHVARARPGDRAQRVDADGGQGRATRGGTPTTSR